MNLMDSEEDAAWNAAHTNAAERLFGKFPGDTLTQEEDEAWGTLSVTHPSPEVGN